MKCLIFFLFVQIPLMNCEFYSSTDKLRELFDIEEEILNGLITIFNDISDISDYLDEKITPWSSEHVKAEKDIEKYITNPLNAFLLIKRNVFDAKIMQKKLTTFVDDLQVKLKNLEQNNFLETSEVAGAVSGIIKVQKTYHLKSEDLVEGIIDGEKTRVSLSLHDVYILANESYRSSAYHASKSYFHIVSEKLEKDRDVFSVINKTEIDYKLKTLANIDVNDQFKEYLNISIIETPNQTRLVTTKLCRGDIARSPKETKNLQCRFASFSAFSKIAPFKLEEASIDPYIVIYHEIISDEEIEELIRLSRPKQVKAGLNSVKLIDDFDRLAQLAWLSDKEHEISARLSERFEDMTGLTMKTAEKLQVQNYGVGGHYNPHYDVDWRRSDETSVTRLATLMLYLSDVEKGGATVFPYIKLLVKPKKGSAVFWYNLKHSGHSDYLTLHSGCPVLLGSKWVANKWIHNNEQEFRRKCQPGKFVLKDKIEEIRQSYKLS